VVLNLTHSAYTHGGYDRRVNRAGFAGGSEP
jgi:hypothetical protein